MSLRIGAIADDFTGATDLAGMLVAAGLRTVQMIGVPTTKPPADVDAVVIALKSRTAPVGDAVAASCAALDWLKTAGCAQVYFKYCSTFDSTDQGNIGPVTDALMRSLGTQFTVACPAFPANRRTVYQGHLFVGDVLLSDSGMRDHPLTPMTDANLVRVLQRQTSRRVGLIAHDVVRHSAAAIRSAMEALERAGVAIAIVDALTDDDLVSLGAACRGLALVTAGSGLALGLGQNFELQTKAAADALPHIAGARAIIAGSCSTTTQAQVAHALAAGVPGYAIDPLALAAGHDVVAAALDWAAARLANGTVLIYATAAPDAVRSVQARLGVARAGELVEAALSRIATGLADRGVRRFIVAGGETSGAVVNALGVSGLRIGPQIDPGVPWTASLGDDPLALALKSGNFGSEDFFIKAWQRFSPS